MRFRSRALVAAASGVVAVGAIIVPFLPTLAGGDNAIVPANRTITEDYYAFAGTVIIEGRVEGDVIAMTQNLTITGHVEGDVLAVAVDTARIGGVIEGSVRLAARDLAVDGEVGDDVVAAAVTGRVRGNVGRDVLTTSGSMRVTGNVGRDVRGQIWEAELNGTVGRDVDISVQSLEVGASAVVGGELSYKASDPASVSAGAVIEGQFIRQRPRNPIQVRALVRLFNVLSLLALLVTGLVLFWLLRRTAPRAVAAVERRPFRTVLVGGLAMIAAPLVALPLAITLVGLPLAAILLGLWLAMLFVGPIPAVTAAVHAVGRGRIGILAAFVIGAIALRAVTWWLPVMGALFYFVALAWGVGGWVLGGWAARRDEGADQLPAMTVSAPPPAPPDDWEPPLPPLTAPIEADDSEE